MLKMQTSSAKRLILGFFDDFDLKETHELFRLYSKVEIFTTTKTQFIVFLRFELVSAMLIIFVVVEILCVGENRKFSWRFIP